MTDTLARPNDLCAVLDDACAEEILALLNHPWVGAAADADSLQVGLNRSRWCR